MAILLEFFLAQWKYVLLIGFILILGARVKILEHEVHSRDTKIASYESDIQSLKLANNKLYAANKQFADDVAQQNASIQEWKDKGLRLQSDLNSAALQIDQLKAHRVKTVQTILTTPIPTRNKNGVASCEESIQWGIEAAKGLAKW